MRITQGVGPKPLPWLFKSSLGFLLGLICAISGALWAAPAQAHELRVERHSLHRGVYRPHVVRSTSVIVAPVVSVGPPAYAYYPGWYHDPYWGWRYGPPRVVLPPPPIIEVYPPVYVERSDVQPVPQAAQPAAPVTGFWYWCSSPAGYYPNVNECPGGWVAVPPASPRP